MRAGLADNGLTLLSLKFGLTSVPARFLSLLRLKYRAKVYLPARLIDPAVVVQLWEFFLCFNVTSSSLASLKVTCPVTGSC